jgi:hypothetical protein
MLLHGKGKAMNLFLFVLENETQLYWRGDQVTVPQAIKAIRKAGYKPVFVERIK